MHLYPLSAQSHSDIALTGVADLAIARQLSASLFIFLSQSSLESKLSLTTHSENGAVKFGAKCSGLLRVSGCLQQKPADRGQGSDVTEFHSWSSLANGR